MQLLEVAYRLQRMLCLGIRLPSTEFFACEIADRPFLSLTRGESRSKNVSHGSPFNGKALKIKEDKGSLQSVKSALVFQENSRKNGPTHRKKKRIPLLRKTQEILESEVNPTISVEVGILTIFLNKYCPLLPFASRNCYINRLYFCFKAIKWPKRLYKVYFSDRVVTAPKSRG